MNDIRKSLIEKQTDEGQRNPLLSRLDGLAESVHVQRRSFVAPFEQIAQTDTVEARNALALPGMLEMAEQAAGRALAAAGLESDTIDVIIASHSTTPMTPGLDVHLVNRLALRPDVMRMPATQLGCVGGAHALSWAAHLADAVPGRRVLVVVSEALSTVYQHTDTSITGMIYRMLFGDAAAACIVTSEPLGPGLHITDTWQYTLPDTMEYYALTAKSDGMHFDSTREAPTGVTRLIEPLWQWIRHRDPDWLPEFVIAHPGGPKVLDLTAKGLGCPPGLLTHSWNSLRDHGNLGGVAVLHILAKTHDDKPRHGANTLLLGVGPGFASASVIGDWHNPTHSAG
ncbi:PhlD [Streptomyces triculaminicus]|uniref:PhlD n=1 Tax=Streptomyces triculaminicus TaxID=2816232 RepID=UPI0037D7CAA9